VPLVGSSDRLQPAVSLPNDKRGQLKHQTDPIRTQVPGGVIRTSSYDALGQVRSVAGTGAEAATTSKAFDYDAAGRVTSISRPGGTIGVTYNDRDDVVQVSDATETSYTYDPAGRLASRTDQAGTSSFTYNNRGLLASASDPLTGATGSYSYRPSGLLEQINYGGGNVTQAFTYDALGRLSTESVHNGSAVLSSTTYGYDENSNVTSKTIAPSSVAGSGTHTYTYDGLDRIRTAGSRTFGWSGLSKELADDGVTTYSMDATGRPVASKVSASASLLISNNRGDIVGTATTNATTLGSSRAFDPWGKSTAQNGSEQPSRGYQGDWTDPDTGRVDMNARLYDPDAGIFTARDSFEDPSMGIRYGYTVANPLSQTDPTGHLSIGGAWNAFNTHVVKPVANHVVKPVYNNVVKPVARWTNDHIIQPVYNAGRNIVRSAVNGTKRVVNTVRRVGSNIRQTASRIGTSIVRSTKAAVRTVKSASVVAYERASTTVRKMQTQLAERAKRIQATVVRPIAALQPATPA
jgi:RHS repeat-associated protein